MARKKTQILMIHGGTTFSSRKNYLHFLKTRKISVKKRIMWHDNYFEKSLGNEFEIIKPSMPLKENARYDDWKINFERYFPFLRDGVILVGGSLGGIFLAKYLSENKFPKKILSTYLICPPFDNKIPTEELVGGFKLKPDLSMIEKNSERLNLLFSKDDNVVPVSHAKKYQKKLKNANIMIYKGKNGHFNVPEFPEIIRMIKDEIKRK